MKLMLVQAQILGISAPLLRWPIRHPPVLAFGRKPAPVELRYRA
jgi:hypothetical protein